MRKKQGKKHKTQQKNTQNDIKMVTKLCQNNPLKKIAQIMFFMQKLNYYSQNEQILGFQDVRDLHYTFHRKLV